MSYDITSGATLQVTMRSILFNQVVMNTFHYKLDNAGPVSGGAAFLSDFNDQLAVPGSFYDTYQACVPAQVTNIQADIQWIFPDRFVKRTFNVFPVGTFPVGTTITNLAAVLELRGDIADKRSIGSKHIPGLSGGSVVAGILSAGISTAVEDFGLQASTIQTVGARVMTPVIYGRARASYTDKHGVVHPALPVSFRPVTEFLVRDTARVLRRRTVGLGI